MSDARAELLLVALGILAWAAIFQASAQGLLHVSWIVSDGLLVLLALMIGYGLWRIWRRWARSHG